MSETGSIIKEDIKNEHPEGVYSRFEVSKDETKEALLQIKKSLPNLINGKLELDKATIDACIESTFFLGKLEEINSIISKGRNDVDKLLGKALAETLSSVEIVLGSETVTTEVIEQITKKNRELIKTLVNSYMDKFAGQRFLEELSRQYNEQLQIYGFSHFMTFMTRAVSNKLVELKKENNDNFQSDIKKLRSVATLFFDLDGLKMLNDMSLGGYNSGDKALWVMARALTNPDLLEWAKDKNIELVPTHRSGDEFLLGIVAKDGIDLGEQQKSFKGIDGEIVRDVSYLKYIGSYIKGIVQNFDKYEMKGMENAGNNDSNKKKNQVTPPISVEDIIDFSIREQRDKFEEVRKKLPKDLQEIFDENFIYRLDCSYGYATLEDGLKSSIQSKINFGDIDHETTAFKLTKVGVARVAENKMKVDKRHSRAERSTSQNPIYKMYEILYRTGREQRDWHIDKEDFKEIHKLLIESIKGNLELRDKLANAKRKLIEQEYEEAVILNKIFDVIRAQDKINLKKSDEIMKIINGDKRPLDNIQKPAKIN